MAQSDASPGGVGQAAWEWIVARCEEPRHWWPAGFSAFNALLSLAGLFSHDWIGKVAGAVLLVGIAMAAHYSGWWTHIDDLDRNRRRLVRAAAIPGITIVVYLAVALAVIVAGIAAILGVLALLNAAGTFGGGPSSQGSGWSGRLSSVGRHDAYYGADGRLSSIGGADVYYDATGRISNIGGDDVHYGADGRMSSVGDADVIYGADDRPSKIGEDDVFFDR